MLASRLVKFCLINFNKRILLKNSPSIPLEQGDEDNNIMKTLRGKNSLKIRDLITNFNDDSLQKNLTFFNMDGIGMQDVTMRRDINKAFLNTLLEVNQNHPSTLLWLKKHLGLDICDTMLKDWEYSGDL